MDDLASFRDKWQKELQISTLSTKVQSKPSEQDFDRDDNESKAKFFFVKGIEMEKAGKMYEAIQFYRRAVQIVPDIEFKIEISPKTKPKDGFRVQPDEGISIYRSILWNKKWI